MLNRKISPISRLKVGTMLAVAVMGVTGLTTNIIQPTHAATINKANNNNDLILGTSWVGNTAPGANDVAQFTSPIPATPFTLQGNATWGSLSVLSPASGVTINNSSVSGANSLTLVNGLSVAAQSLAINVTNLNANVIGASQTWSNASGTSIVVTSNLNVSGTNSLDMLLSGAATLAGNVSAGKALIKDGAGTLSLSGNNGASTILNSGVLNLNSSTSTTSLTINGGTIDNTSALPANTFGNNPYAGSILLNNPALIINASQVDFTGTRSLDFQTGAVSFNVDTTLNVANNFLVFRSNLNASKQVTKIGNGTLVLTGTNTFGGGLVLSQGTVFSTAVAAFGALGNTTTIPTGGNVYLSMTGDNGNGFLGANSNGRAFTGLNAWVIDGTASFYNAITDWTNNGGGNGWTFNGLVGGSGAIIYGEPSALVLNSTLGANTFTGTIQVVSGGFTLNKFSTNITNAVPSTMTVALGGVNVNITTSGGTVGAASDSFNVNLLPGASSFTPNKNGATTSLVETWTFTRNPGATFNYQTQNGSTLTLGAGSVGPGYFTVNNNDWAAPGSGAVVALTTYDATLGAGLNTLVSATNSSMTFADTSVNSIKFNYGADTNGPVANLSVIAAAGTHTITSGGILDTSAGNGSNSALTANITGAGAITSGTSDLVVIQNNGTARLNIDAKITGAIGLTKAGAGTLVLSGANDFSGNTWLDAGILVLNSANSLGSGNSVFINGGGTLRALGGLTKSTLAVGGAGTSGFSGSSLTSNLSVPAGQSLTFGNVSTALAFPGAAGQVAFSGGGTFNFPTLNSFAVNLLDLRGVTINATNSGASNVTIGATQMLNTAGLTTLNLNPGAGSITLTFVDTNIDAGTNVSIGGAMRINATDPSKVFVNVRGNGNFVAGGAYFHNNNGSPWTFGLTDFAADDASRSAIVPLASLSNSVNGYDNISLATGSTINSTTNLNHLNFTGSGTAALDTGGGANFAIRAMRFDAATGAQTVFVGTAGTTLGLGGVLLTPGVGANIVTIDSPGSTGTSNGFIRAYNGAASTLNIWQNDAAGTLVLAAPIGLGVLNKLGAGLTIISNLNNTFVGPIFVSEGTLQMNDNRNYAGGTGGGTIVLNGGTFLANGTFNQGVVMVGEAGGTVNVANSQTMTVSVALNNYNYVTSDGVAQSFPGVLNKTGPGNLTIGATATVNFRGDTTINGGLLAVNQSTSGLGSGSVVVNSGGTLGGFGALFGSTVTVNAGGSINPGDPALNSGVGTLTLMSTATTNGVANLILASGVTLSYDMSLAGNDLVVLPASGSLTVGGPLSFNFFQGGTNFAFRSNGVYNLITGFSDGNFSGIALSGSNITNFNVLNGNPAHYAFTMGKVAGIDTIQLTITGEQNVSVWNGTSSSSWGASTAWVGGVVPNSAGDAASFGLAGKSTAPITLDGDRRVGTLLLANSTSGGYTINAGTPANSRLIIDNGTLTGLVSVSNGSHIINTELLLANTTNIQLSNSGSLSLNGVISSSATGSKNLNLSGLGTVLITSDANTWVGKVTVALGAGIQFGDGIGGTTGSLPGSTITLNGGSFVNGFAGTQLVSALRPFSGTGSLVQNAAGNLIIDTTLGNFTGTIGVRSGTMSLSAPTVLSKGVELSGGVFDLAGFDATVSSITGTSYIANSGATANTIRVQVTNPVSFSGGFTGSGSVTLALASDVARTVTLDGTTAGSGTGGTIRLIRNGPLSAGAQSTVFLEIAKSGAVHPNTVIELDETYGLANNGAGIPVLQLANGVNLPSYVLFSTVQVTPGSWRYQQEAIGVDPNSSATFSGNMISTGGIAGSATDANGSYRVGTGLNGSNSTLTITGSLTSTGSGFAPMFFLNYGGKLVFNNATVSAMSSGGVGSNMYFGNLISNRSGNIVITGSNINTVGAPATDIVFFGVTNGGGGTTFPGAATNTVYNYTINGNTSINVGPGTINWNGANAASNTMTMNISNSTFSAGGFRSSSTTGASTMTLDGAKFIVNGGGAGTWGAGATVARLGAGGITFDVSSGDLDVQQSFNSNLTSGIDGGLTVIGGGTDNTHSLVMSGSNNTYSGPTKIMNAGVKLNAPNALPATTVVSLLTNDSTSRLDLNSNFVTVAGLDSNGTASSVTGGGTLTINTAPLTTYTFGGNFNENSLGKGGIGTQNIVGATTISGNISIAGGILNFGRADLPSLTIIAGGGFQSLGGDATIQSTLGSSGNAVVQAGSFVGPRVNGGTINFVLNGGTNPDTNKFVITSANGFIDQGLFFNGSDFAWADASGFLRAASYGTDTNTAVAAGSAITDAKHYLVTGGATAGNVSVLTLKLGATGNITQTGGTTLLLTNAGLLKAGGDTSTISGGNIQFGASMDPVVRVDTGSTLVINSSIIDNNNGGVFPSNAVKVGQGMLVLGGVNTYGGKWNINGGSVTLNSSAGMLKSLVVLAYQGATTSSLLFGPGVTATTIGGLASPAGGAANLVLQTTDASPLPVALTLAMDSLSGTTQTYDGIISGSGSLILNATNGMNFILTGVNSFTGGLTLSGGTVTSNQPTFADGAIDTTLGTGAIIFNGGSLRLRNNTNAIYNNALTVNASTTNLLDLNGNSNATFKGNMTGTGTLERSGGTGALNLSGNNTAFAGTFRNDVGSVNFLNAGAISPTASYIFNNTNGSETVTINSNAVNALTLGMITGATGNTFNISNLVTSGTRYTLVTLGLDGAAGTGTFGGVIGNGGGAGAGIAINKVGTGTLTLLGANTFNQTNSYTDGTFVLRISNGAVVAANAAALGGGGAIGLGGGAATTTDAALFIAGVTTNATQSLTVLASAGGTYTLGGNTAGNSNFAGNVTLNHDLNIVQLDPAGTFRLSGLLAGASNVTASGGGSIILGATSSALFSGQIAVTGSGTRLYFNGSATNAATGFTVGSGATLGGSGTINGAIVVQSGAHVAPGSGGVGTLNLASGNVNLQNGSIIDIELVDPVTQGDVLRVGTLTLGGSNVVNLLNVGVNSPFITNGIYSIFSITSSNSAFSNLSLGNVPAGVTATLSSASGGTVLVTISGGITYGLWQQNADGVWETGTNWAASLVPNGTGNTADFRNVITSNVTRNISTNSDKTLSVIKFNNTTGTYNVGSPTTTIHLVNGTAPSAAIITNTAASNRISAGLSLDTNTTISTATNASLLLVGQVGGVGALTVIGAGSLVIGDTLNLPAGTQVAAGANLVFGAGAAAGTFLGSINNLGTVAFNRSGSFNFEPVFLNNATSGILANLGASSIMTLGGFNQLAGSLSVAGGTVRLGSSVVISDATPVNVGANGTLDLGGQQFNWTPAGLTFNGRIGNSNTATFGTITLGSGAAVTYSGVLTDLGGSLNVFKNGTSATATTFSSVQNFTQGSTTIVVNGAAGSTINYITVSGTGAVNYLGQNIFIQGYGSDTQNTNGALLLNNGVILGNGSLSQLSLGDPSNAALHGEIFNVAAAGVATFGGNIVFPLGEGSDTGTEIRLGTGSTGTLVLAGTIDVPAILAPRLQINRGNVALGGTGKIIMEGGLPFLLGNGAANGNNGTVTFTVSDNSSIVTSTAAGAVAIAVGPGGLTSGTQTFNLTGNAIIDVGTGGAGLFDLDNNTASTYTETAPQGALQGARVNVNINGGTLRLAGFTRTAAPLNLGSGDVTQGSTLNLNGGTIVAIGTDGQDLFPATTLTAATRVNANGSTIDLNNHIVTMSQPLMTPSSGTVFANQTDGGIGFKSSTGTGTINLTGSKNTYRGATTVGSGALVKFTNNSDLGDQNGGALTLNGGTVQILADVALNNSALNAATAGVLTHRYTFSGDYNDAVGGVTGTALGTSNSFASGALVVHGEANAGGGVSLDANAINLPSYNAATIMVWFTKAAPVTTDAGLFAFGGTNINSSANGYQYLIGTANTGGGVRTAITNSGNGFNVNGSQGETAVVDATSTAVGEHQMAVVVNNGSIAVYLDGVFKGSQVLRSDYGGDTLAGLSNALAYIGTSVNFANPSFNGAIDEFRIYNQALTLNDIASANQLVTVGSVNNFTPQANTAVTGLTSRNVAVTPAGGTIDLNTHTLTITGDVLGSGLATTASGVGNINFANGNLVTFAGRQLPSTVGSNTFYSNINVGAGMTLRVVNSDQPGVLGGGSVTLVAANSALVINRTGVSTFGSGIAGIGPVSHIGSGTTTLNGNGYTATGDVTISAGQLGFSPTSNTRNTPGISLSFQHLNMSNGTVLDSTNHDMLIGNTTVATVQDQILAAFGAGNNPNGPQITSSTFGIDDAFMIPLSADVFGGVGNQTIDGVPITQPNSVWTKYTYNGDVTLDGLVDSSDIGQVVSDYILNTTTPGLADITTSWTAGDLDFSGAVDANDIGQVVSSYILHSNSPQLGQLDGLAAPSISGGGSAVPEPATLFLLGLGSAGMLLRRKRKA